MTRKRFVSIWIYFQKISLLHFLRFFNQHRAITHKHTNIYIYIHFSIHSTQYFTYILFHFECGVSCGWLYASFFFFALRFIELLYYIFSISRSCFFSSQFNIIFFLLSIIFRFWMDLNLYKLNKLFYSQSPSSHFTKTQQNEIQILISCINCAIEIYNNTIYSVKYVRKFVNCYLFRATEKLYIFFSYFIRFTWSRFHFQPTISGRVWVCVRCAFFSNDHSSQCVALLRVKISFYSQFTSN